MLSGTSIFTTKAGGGATALAVLLCAVAYSTLAAAGVDSRDVLPVNLTAGGALLAHVQSRALGAQYPSVAAPASALNAATAAVFPSDHLVRLRYSFGSDPGLPSDRARPIAGDDLLKNSDAALRADVRLTLVNEWRGFVYADIGAADSEVRWQGLAGLHHRLGVDLLGGWRHVTYHFSPGRGFDSLEFKGPYLGAALAW